jgi:hypothetical protein
MNLSNKNSDENYFYVKTINHLCKKEMRSLVNKIPRTGLKIYDGEWIGEGLALKYKKILIDHIKNFDISKIVLYNTVPPRRISVESFKRCFYISDVTTWESDFSSKSVNIVPSAGEDSYRDEHNKDSILISGTVLVCY